MTMDIRNAKRPEKGTAPSRLQTAPKAEEKLTPTVNSDGTLNEPPSGISEDLILRENWEYLKEHDITEEDLKNILDSILTTGNVQWEFKLFDRIPVIFKIREGWVDDLIIDRIDELTADKGKVSALRYTNLVAEMNLAASILRFGDRTFNATDEASFSENLNFIRALAFIHRNRLIEKLAVFDRAVTIATSEWSLKNFTKPPLEG